MDGDMELALSLLVERSRGDESKWRHYISALPREMLPNLSDEAFNLASSETPPIVIDYDIYVQNGDWIAEKWQELLTGA